MIRSINIFKSTSEKHPIRIEFWDTDKMFTVYEVAMLTGKIIIEMENFIRGQV